MPALTLHDDLPVRPDVQPGYRCATEPYPLLPLPTPLTPRLILPQQHQQTPASVELLGQHHQQHLTANVEGCDHGCSYFVTIHLALRIFFPATAYRVICPDD